MDFSVKQMHTDAVAGKHLTATNELLETTLQLQGTASHPRDTRKADMPGGATISTLRKNLALSASSR